MASLPAWSFYGYGFTMATFFFIKYVVSYGMTISLAKFEGVSVPTVPKCIGGIHLYSDMWKYFDAGLYNFLLRYIYVPSMNCKWFQNRFVSTLLCFTFVYIWHGTETFVLIWSSINFLGVVIENISKSVDKNYLENSEYVAKIGPAWKRRLDCVIACPLIAMSAIGSFYFFAKSHIGDIFLFRLLNGTLEKY